MMRTLCIVLTCLFSVPLMSQQASLNSSTPRIEDESSKITAPGAVVEPVRPAAKPSMMEPFSQLAFGGGIGIMGVNLQAATNLHRYFNLRASGNIFTYSINDISSNGFTASGKLNFASMGVSLDFYPWPIHGLRLSPGLLLYNENSLTASGIVTPGNSFTLNHVDYYSSFTDPIHANAKLGLNATTPAFTLTAGWGNMISRKRAHWSFPCEIGAAFVGSPSVRMPLTGTACNSTGTSCVNAATDPNLQANLQAQIDKYKNDLDPLKVFPILSAGVSYRFDLKRTH